MSNFSGDFFTTTIDPGVTIKQEPVLSDNTSNITMLSTTSASVPIPQRRTDMEYQRGFTTDLLDNSQSPQYNLDSGNILLNQQELYDNPNMWNNHLMNTDDLLKSEIIQMDDDDIFQVDKADLIQGPTLAELNANDESLFVDFNFDDLVLPEGSTNYITLDKPQFNSNYLNNNQFSGGINFYRENELIGDKSAAFSPGSSNSSLLPSSPLHSTSLQQKHSTLHELLLKRDSYDSPDRTILGKSVPGAGNTTLNPVKQLRQSQSRLSSSAPTHLGLDQIWQRREPRKHLLSTGSLAEAGSTSSLSTGGILSPDPQDLSHDEFESDEDSDHYEDYSSDNADSDDDGDTQKSSKKERYFWQYNVQAKGPKGQRLVMKCKMEDPHVLNEITDPVFSPDCSVRGIKHSGKARKGDGNDLTPNPKKLYSIGRELDKLVKVINDMTPVSELPVNARSSSRKEKNKLASRACRLKKKAQHEANKIKLNGLEAEHKRLINGIAQAKQILAAKLAEQVPEKQEELTRSMDKVVKSATKIRIAGHTTEYVNKILDKFKSGGIVVTSSSFADDL